MKTRLFTLIFGLSLVLPSFASAANLSVSQSSVSLNVGQTATVTVFGAGDQTVNIMSHTNVNVAAAVMSGNTLTILAQSAGSSEIKLCTSDLSCVTVNVFVSQLTLSQTNISLNVGQTATVSISGGASPYFVNVIQPSTLPVSASISGSTLTLTGLSTGGITLTICDSSFSPRCANLFVSVNQSQNPVTLTQSSLSLNLGQSTSLNIFGGYSSYYVSSNTNPSVVSASISGSRLDLFASSNNSGNAVITVCESSGARCASVTIAVVGTNLSFLTQSLPNPQVGSFYSVQLQATGGNLPYTFAVVSGSLPSGLNISSSGIISGTASNNQARSFTIRVTDNFGRTAFQNYTLIPTGTVFGCTNYSNGSLINDNGTIYIIYRNTKSGFANMSAFLGLGYRLSNVINSSTACQTSTNFVINHSAQAHPWGSWVKSGSTIYFVHESGLIPISTFDIFLSNGGNVNNVVDLNVYDSGKPILPLMTYDDPRLK